MQSTNEELHSVNEELYTDNAEHQRSRNDAAHRDMDNLLASTEIGTIFLDLDLTVASSPAVARIFNLMPQDVGRPLSTSRTISRSTAPCTKIERVRGRRRGRKEIEGPQQTGAAVAFFLPCKTARLRERF